MPSKKGLGKGLGALFVDAGEVSLNESGIVDFGHSAPSDSEQIVKLKIIDVEPNRAQARKYFDAEALEDLANSIKEHGIISPILVHKTEGGIYKIIAGERRWRAAKKAGLKTIPCIVKNYDDMASMSVSLIENLQRENLNPVEEAEGYRLLMDTFELNQEAVSERVGKSRSAVANSLRLCGLPDEIKDLMMQNLISAGHARALISVTPKAKQMELAQMAAEKQLSVRQLEAIIKDGARKAAPRPKKTEKQIMTEIHQKEVQNLISKNLGAKVEIVTTKSTIKFVITSTKGPEIDRLVHRLAGTGKHGGNL